MMQEKKMSVLMELKTIDEHIIPIRTCYLYKVSFHFYDSITDCENGHIFTIHQELIKNTVHHMTIGEIGLSNEEVNTYLQTRFANLKGTDEFEIEFKMAGFYSNKHSQDYPAYIQHGINFDTAEGGKHNLSYRYRNGIKIVDVKLVSAQKGNGFYHEDEIIDLTQWTSNETQYYELFLTYEVEFSDGTVAPIFTTFTNKEQLFESWERYKKETGARIFQTYSFALVDKFDLSYWQRYFHQVESYYPGIFKIKTKEEALIKYYYMGFDIANYQQLTTMVLGESDSYYTFDGKVEIVESGLIDIVNELDRKYSEM